MTNVELVHCQVVCDLLIKPTDITVTESNTRAHFTVPQRFEGWTGVDAE